MPYNPSVNDNSGQILAGYQTKSAEIKAAGNEALTKGIVDGSLSAIGGITGGVMDNYTKAADNKMTSEYLDSMAGQMAGTLKADGKTPFMSAEQLAKFTSGSNSQKAGMLVPIQAQYDNMLKMNYLNQQISGFGHRQQMQTQVPANQVPMAPQGAAPATPAPFQFGQGIKVSPQF